MTPLLEGAIAGLIAGIVATWIMDRFQYNWWDVAAFVERRRGPAPGATPPAAPATTAAPETEEFSGPSTARVANWLFRRWKGRNLSGTEKGPAGEMVHYAFGIANAVLFGAVLSALGTTGVAWGIGFGVALFVGFDELGLWALGLAKGPWNYLLSIHAYALAAHVVYGLALGAGYYVIRTLLFT